MSLSINSVDLRLLETISVRAGGILNIWTCYVAFSYSKINLARLQSFFRSPRSSIVFDRNLLSELICRVPAFAAVNHLD